MIKDYKAKLIEKTWHSEVILLMKFELIDADYLDFVAGQFVNIILPNKIARAYSIASSPHHNNRFEIYFGYIQNGKASEYFKAMKIGEVINFKAPFGKFVYREDNVENVVMVGTGTGIAPIKSIVEQLHENKLKGGSPNLPLIYVFEGTRYLKDVVYNKFFETYKSEEFINYELWLSRESEEYNGNKGRVNVGLDRLTINWVNASVYVCGNMEVVLSLVEYFKKKGVPQEKIYFERFN